MKMWGRRGSHAYFLAELRGGSASLVRSRKGLLIAQEQRSLIWRPQCCSGLQTHGELISTLAIDRKTETHRGWSEEKEEGGNDTADKDRSLDMWLHQLLFPPWCLTEPVMWLLFLLFWTAPWISLGSFSWFNFSWQTEKIKIVFIIRSRPQLSFRYMTCSCRDTPDNVWQLSHSLLRSVSLC